MTPHCSALAPRHAESGSVLCRISFACAVCWSILETSFYRFEGARNEQQSNLFTCHGVNAMCVDPCSLEWPFLQHLEIGPFSFLLDFLDDQLFLMDTL